jgi:enoyl-[acyl-carrier protein] reductase II
MSNKSPDKLARTLMNGMPNPHPDNCVFASFQAKRLICGSILNGTLKGESRMTALFNKLTQRGRDFLGVETPVICGAMTWLSDANLAATMARCGGFGLIAAGNHPPETLEREILRARELTDRPFGVNLITIAPNYKAHLDLVCALGCSHVVFAGVFPDGASIRKVKDAGAKTLCFAPTESLARRMIKFGIDALVVEGHEAGGHIGPVSTIVLLQEVLFAVRDEVPVFVAGGIGSGRMIAHALLMGAAGVQLGTRFVMSEECRAHAAFKESFRKAGAKDAVVSPTLDARLPVIPVRCLKNDGMGAFKHLQLDLMQQLDVGSITRQEAGLQVEGFWVGALRRAAEEGNVASGSLMAGQSVGFATEVKPMAEIFAELIGDAEDELARVAGIV